MNTPTQYRMGGVSDSHQPGRSYELEIWNTRQGRQCEPIVYREPIEMLEGREKSSNYPTNVKTEFPLNEHQITNNIIEQPFSLSKLSESGKNRTSHFQEYDKFELKDQIQRIFEAMSCFGNRFQHHETSNKNIEMEIMELKEAVGKTEIGIQEILKKLERQTAQNERLYPNYTPDQSLRNQENLLPLKGVLQDNHSLQRRKSFLKKKVLYIYNETKLYTDSTLKKLENDLQQDYEIESLYIANLHGYQTKIPDKLFFFYFSTTGREQALSINDFLSTISKKWSGKPLYLVILKDFKCREPCLDLQRIKISRDKIKEYKIFEEKYANLALYIPTPSRSMKQYISQVKTNYELLVSDIKTMISQD